MVFKYYCTLCAAFFQILISNCPAPSWRVPFAFCPAIFMENSFSPLLCFIHGGSSLSLPVLPLPWRVLSPPCPVYYQSALSAFSAPTWYLHKGSRVHVDFPPFQGSLSPCPTPSIDSFQSHLICLFTGFPVLLVLPPSRATCTLYEVCPVLSALHTSWSVSLPHAYPIMAHFPPAPCLN